MLYKIGVHKIFAKFTGKHLHWSLFNLVLKRDSHKGIFLRIFSEYPFFTEHLQTTAFEISLQ